MFLTRSIRRKLVLGLGLVLLMLLLLGVSGFTGLWSYRSVVHDLQGQLDTEPRRTDLAVAMGGLSRPLLGFRSADRQLLQFDATLWSERFEIAQSELREYRRRVRALPRTPDAVQRSPIIEGKLDQIQWTLNRLDERSKRIRESRDNLEREGLLDSMVRDVAALQFFVGEMPNSDQGFHDTLREAAAAYRWRLWLIGGLSLAVIPLLGFLYWCGYKWIFVRIRMLYEAAHRVASGDYTYRVSFTGKDEIVDLAKTFNQMIDRFQRDKSEADREAQSRGEQMVRCKHLVDLGQMASGIAHEINNPLSSIQMASESLLERLNESDGTFGKSESDREVLRAYLPMIAQAADRCQAITRRTLDIARNNNGPKTRYDLTKIVVEVLDRLKYVKGHEHIEIEFDRSKPHSADVNTGEIVQVVQNLVMNALEAMDGYRQGKVTISLDETMDEVILRVTDTGCGMTPNVLQNIYKPFFTEKTSGKGTGLGLSIVDRIIGEHGGRIEALSDGPGCGSTFIVHLPRRSMEAASAA